MTVTGTTTEQDLIDDVHAIEQHAIEQHAVETVVTVRAAADEQIRGLKAALANLAAERDAERRRADLAEKAGVEMANAIVAGLRREALLEKQRDEARRERNRARINDRVSGEIAVRAADDVRDRDITIAAQTDDIVRLTTDLGVANTQLADARRQLADARRPRILRRPRPTT